MKSDNQKTNIKIYFENFLKKLGEGTAILLMIGILYLFGIEIIGIGGCRKNSTLPKFNQELIDTISSEGSNLEVTETKISKNTIIPNQKNTPRNDQTNSKSTTIKLRVDNDYINSNILIDGMEIPFKYVSSEEDTLIVSMVLTAGNHYIKLKDCNKRISFNAPKGIIKNYRCKN